MTKVSTRLDDFAKSQSLQFMDAVPSFSPPHVPDQLLSDLFKKPALVTISRSQDFSHFLIGWEYRSVIWEFEPVPDHLTCGDIDTFLALVFNRLTPALYNRGDSLIELLLCHVECHRCAGRARIAFFALGIKRGEPFQINDPESRLQNRFAINLYRSWQLSGACVTISAEQ